MFSSWIGILFLVLCWEGFVLPVSFSFLVPTQELIQVRVRHPKIIPIGTSTSKQQTRVWGSSKNWPGHAPDFDADRWIRWCSESYQNFTNVSLWDKLGASTCAEIHGHAQYGLLSHGTQDDPIYCYFNRAALEVFGREPDEVSTLASRYSAPPDHRTARSALIQETLETKAYQDLPPLIRVNKAGELFRVTGVILWNIYNDQQEVVGQTALFDRQQVAPLTPQEYQATLPSV